MSREDEIAALKAKLEARRGRTGLSENVREIEARIAVLEGQK